MNKFKWCLSLALSCVLLFSLSAQAVASSDYDNFLKTTPTLYVYTDGGTKTQKMDISSTWWSDFKQTYAKRVAQNIGWPTDFATEFEDIRSNGGSWGVFIRETNDGNMVTIVGTHDPDAECGFNGPANAGLFECTANSSYGFVRAGYFTHNSYGGNGCIGSWQDRCSNKRLNIYQDPVVVSSGGGTFVSIDNTSLSDYEFFFMNFDIDYPTGYEGEIIPSEQPHAKYVAMGDSFSSGEGNPSFETGTDEGGLNECHRSPLAYPRLLEDELEFETTAFVACSGATTSNVLYGGASDGNWDEGPQIDALSEETEIVTITIGGNDVGFKVFATNCTLASCSVASQAYNNIMNEINNDFQDDLENTYETVLEKSGDAIIYVVGYPYLTGDSSVDDCQTFEIVSDLGARAVTDAVNVRIESAVNVVRSDINHPDYDDRLIYVPANSSSSTSPFDGNFICSSPPYFNDLDTINQEYSFHPNSLGHSAYATILEGEIN